MNQFEKSKRIQQKGSQNEVFYGKPEAPKAWKLRIFTDPRSKRIYFYGKDGNPEKFTFKSGISRSYLSIGDLYYAGRLKFSGSTLIKKKDSAHPVGFPDLEIPLAKSFSDFFLELFSTKEYRQYWKIIDIVYEDAIYGYPRCGVRFQRFLCDYESNEILHVKKEHDYFNFQDFHWKICFSWTEASSLALDNFAAFASEAGMALASGGIGNSVKGLAVRQVKKILFKGSLKTITKYIAYELIETIAMNTMKILLSFAKTFSKEMGSLYGKNKYGIGKEKQKNKPDKQNIEKAIQKSIIEAVKTAYDELLASPRIAVILKDNLKILDKMDPVKGSAVRRVVDSIKNNLIKESVKLFYESFKDIVDIVMNVLYSTPSSESEFASKLEQEIIKVLKNKIPDKLKQKIIEGLKNQSIYS